jgi:hypothetical protein
LGDIGRESWTARRYLIRLSHAIFGFGAIISDGVARLSL